MASACGWEPANDSPGCMQPGQRPSRPHGRAFHAHPGTGAALCWKEGDMILVFGKTGQLARELAAFDGVTCLGRDQADLSEPEACAEILRARAPAAVINAAAYTAVDRAEEEEELATV